MLDEVAITHAIIDSYYKKLTSICEVDVAICGAGPSGLICANELALRKKKVVIFERKLSIGGGMWAGGMLFNNIVVQKQAKSILDEYKIRTYKYTDGYYVADAIECVCALGYYAVKRGVVIINGVSVEDVMVRKNRVCGVVINWSAVEIADLHVDPLTIRAKIVVDATGHPTEIVNIVQNKSGIRLKTNTGKILGEKSMWAEVAEDTVQKNTQEVCGGLFVAGMCANTVYGAPRMGPIFGGMLLSGKKCAKMILSRL